MCIVFLANINTHTPTHTHTPSIPDLIMVLARERDGESDKMSLSDNGRVLPLAAARRSLALDNSVSMETTFEDSSSTSAL